VRTFLGTDPDEVRNDPCPDRSRPASWRAEHAGFDSIWCSDHVVMPETVRSRYPFSDDGSIRWDPAEPWYDAVVWCAAIAVVTERVEFGTAVMLAGLRHPLVLAKQLASIDAISGGRLIAGFGAGWMAEEFEAMDVPFESRGRRLDEWIDICRLVWTGRVAEVAGDHFAADLDVLTEPRPARRIPILIGGMSDAALRRVATRADGWVPLVRSSQDPVATIERGVNRLRELADEVGRATTEFRVVYNAADPAEAGARLDALAQVGVTDVMVDVDYGDPDGPARALAAATRGW
jgi:probable F420-dependent oxidoreductase